MRKVARVDLYTRSGWYQIDDSTWVHLLGRCVKAEHDRAKGRYLWRALPNGSAPATIPRLRDAKEYVEIYGTNEHTLRKLTTNHSVSATLAN